MNNKRILETEILKIISEYEENSSMEGQIGRVAGYAIRSLTDIKNLILTQSISEVSLKIEDIEERLAFLERCWDAQGRG